nr:TPA_asm: 37 kDa protein [Phalaenopsis ophiovirus]
MVDPTCPIHGSYAYQGQNCPSGGCPYPSSLSVPKKVTWADRSVTGKVVSHCSSCLSKNSMRKSHCSSCPTKGRSSHNNSYLHGTKISFESNKMNSTDNNVKSWLNNHPSPSQYSSIKDGTITLLSRDFKGKSNISDKTRKIYDINGNSKSIGSSSKLSSKTKESNMEETSSRSSGKSIKSYCTNCPKLMKNKIHEKNNRSKGSSVLGIKNSKNDINMGKNEIPFKLSEKNYKNLLPRDIPHIKGKGYILDTGAPNHWLYYNNLETNKRMPMMDTRNDKKRKYIIIEKGISVKLNNKWVPLKDVCIGDCNSEPIISYIQLVEDGFINGMKYVSDSKCYLILDRKIMFELDKIDGYLYFTEK